jgi:SAM-dependent methyltransferase
LNSRIAYLKYFFYLAINWNLRLAWFIIKREIIGEKKYNLQTTGIDDLSKSVAAEDREHASIYQPVNYYTAEKLFSNIDSNDLTGAFLDVGCGKGRVIALAAAYGFQKIIGIDLSPQLCNHAIQLADNLEAKYPAVSVEIECEDARTYEIPGLVSALFLFNPFDDLVMTDFLKQVAQSLQKNPRPLKVLYANPQCKKQWLDAGFKEIDHFKKLNYLEGSVLVHRVYS